MYVCGCVLVVFFPISFISFFACFISKEKEEERKKKEIERGEGSTKKEIKKEKAWKWVSGEVEYSERSWGRADPDQNTL